jgi:hypothetical protein
MTCLPARCWSQRETTDEHKHAFFRYKVPEQATALKLEASLFLTDSCACMPCPALLCPRAVYSNSAFHDLFCSFSQFEMHEGKIEVYVSITCMYCFHNQVIRNANSAFSVPVFG